MTASLAFPDPILRAALPLLDDAVESAGTATARRSGSTLLVGDLQWMPEDAYERREARGLAVRSHGWAPRLVAAVRSGYIPVFVHTHPGGQAFFSEADDRVDATIAEELQRITGCSETASVVIAGTSDRPTLVARRVLDGVPGPAEDIRVAGPGLVFHRAPSRAEPSGADPAYDRQNRALGAEGRSILSGVSAGLAGTGGTGSPTAEQLIRLGIGELIVVDDDVVTESTPTRGYGSGAGDIGRPKVDTIADLNDRIGLGGTKVIPLQLNVRDPRAVDALADCDVVFGCTDGHASRVVLNRLAYWHLIPVIDLGVLITSTDAGIIRSVDARVTIIGPGLPCLLCRGRVSPELARVELLDPVERRALAAEGYVPDLDDPAPSVVVYTTMVSTVAVAEFLHRLFGIGDRAYSEVLIRPDLPTIRNNSAVPRPGCFCADEARWGLGTTEPRLDLTW